MGRKKRLKKMEEDEPEPEPIIDGSDIVPYLSYNALFFSAIDEDIQFEKWGKYFIKKLFYYHRWLSLLIGNDDDDDDDDDRAIRKRRFKPTIDSLYLLYTM